MEYSDRSLSPAHEATRVFRLPAAAHAAFHGKIHKVSFESDDQPLLISSIYMLSQGTVFFHELGLSRIPFSASNIVMDIGLAPCPAPWRRADTKKDPLPATATPLDRATYPVKYYLASLDDLLFVGLEGRDDNVLLDDPSEEYTRDVANLGTLVKDLFSSVCNIPTCLSNLPHFI